VVGVRFSLKPQLLVPIQLGRTERIAYIHSMRAAEIIEQIKRLPLEEKRAVKDFVNTEGEATSGSEVEYVDRKALEQTAQQIFKEHEDLFRKLAQ
jgi:hypothetical protein